MALSDEPAEIPKQVNVATVTDTISRSSPMTMQLPFADYLAQWSRVEQTAHLCRTKLSRIDGHDYAPALPDISFTSQAA